MAGRQVAWTAGVGVTLAAINSAVINELHGGWKWWVACSVLTLAGAVLAGWLAARPMDTQQRIGRGAVVAGRDIGGRVRTDGSAVASVHDLSPALGVNPGAVVAGQDITEQADIDTTGQQPGRTPKSGG
ncbi:hypothetical protein E0H26_27375 [Micromonospora zingiberis]|uniref:Uncharacterized protein n=1 Tax=Micromonospora zingiberis TaxID=2053011 RepID=A0A4R0G2E5_9ACTN|nr:hypothetical protein [Micromonospora zingiberis]TCB90296.1 hypothetical protein E0H26_27375 [Micromonospora zingiberis]